MWQTHDYQASSRHYSRLLLQSLVSFRPIPICLGQSQDVRGHTADMLWSTSPSESTMPPMKAALGHISSQSFIVKNISKAVAPGRSDIFMRFPPRTSSISTTVHAPYQGVQRAL